MKRLAAAVVVSATEAGKKDDPDNPVTAIVATAVISAQDTISAAIAATIIATTEEQQKDNPDAAVVASQNTVIISTSARCVAAAVSSS